MAILNAKHYNTNENYVIINRFNETHNGKLDIAIDKKEIEKKIDSVVKEIVRKLNK